MARPKSGYIVAEGGKKVLRGFNIQIGNRRTSVRLSPVIVKAVEKIAERERCELDELYSYIDRKKEKGVSMATAIREFVVRYFMEAANEAGHRKAGHGKLIGKRTKGKAKTNPDKYRASPCTIDVTLAPEIARTLNQRQLWFLGAILDGERLRAEDIARSWQVVHRTAKRDVAGLQEQKLIRYTGAKKTGRYEIVTR
jgi:predicted DNA-binding ribbon-helix-helix protein